MDFAPPRIFMDESVFSELLYDAMGTIRPKTHGLLIGERYEVRGENFINVVASVSIEKRGDPFPFLFREEDYLEANGSHKLTISNAVVVGWYRVGSGEGVADMEMLTHKAYFKFPWQLFLKVDRENKEYSLYRGDGNGALELVDLLLYNDRFRGFFDPEAGNGEAPAGKGDFSEDYTGSIQRAKRVIRQLEEELGARDRELAEMRASVRTELASKLGNLEREIQESREKIHSLRTVMVRQPEGHMASVPPVNLPIVTEAPGRRRDRQPLRRLVAAAACASIIGLGAFAYITEPARPARAAEPVTAAIAPGSGGPAGGSGVAVPGGVTVEVASGAPKAPRRVSHLVQEGDTLWDLSKTYLGEGALFRQIARENGLKGEGQARLKPGTILTITLP